MNKEAIESMLENWARFYIHYELSGLGFPHKSVVKPEIRSTKRQEDIKIPNDVEIIDIAIIRLTPRQRQVVKAEYMEPGYCKHKAAKLELTWGCYRATLSHAKNNLIQILDTI